jgi:hypothetical protein
MKKEKIYKQYKIYHPVDGDLNYNASLSDFDFEEIGIIESENLVRAYYHSQNDFNAKYAAFGVRSTSVGDLIEDLTDNALYMCMGIGYKRIDKRQITIITAEDLIKLDISVESLQAAQNSLDIVNKILDK